jgi:hypothetical protein
MTKGGFLDRQFKLFALGISEDADPQEAEAFQTFVHEINVIVRGGGKAYTAKDLSDEVLSEIVREVAKA